MMRKSGVAGDSRGRWSVLTAGASSGRRSSAGVTLVEVLASIAVIVALLGLVLGAVTAARAWAGRKIEQEIKPLYGAVERIIREDGAVE